MDQKLQRGFQIGPFKVEPLSGHITGPTGDQEHVQPKVMDVLVCLAEHSGELLERDTILLHIWRRATSEEVLTRCISELRRVLQDDSGHPTYIQTIPKRGYRLLSPVVFASQRVEDTSFAERESTDATTGSGNPPALSNAVASVAVLPFENHSRDEAYLFVADAFSSELHSTLAHVDRLRVASRRSSFVFKDAKTDVRDIAKQLNVHYVISGSLRCDGRRLRVIAELDDGDQGIQVWARSYDREIEDVFSVEREIAEAIVSSFTTLQLSAEIRNARREPTNNLDAWGLVQKSRAFALDYTAEGLTQAIAPLERAIELDPDYPAAHATLGSLLAERLVNGLSSEPKRDEAAALDAVNKALALAPQDPFILKMVSLVWAYSGDHRKAINCLRKAVSYAPFDFGAWGYMGWPMTASGDAQELCDLQRILDRLLKMEPHHPGVPFWLYHKAVADVCEGNYESARKSSEAAIDLRPNLSLAWMHYANVLGHQTLKREAEQALDRCKAINPAMTRVHFESLVRKMSDNPLVIDRRLGGLRNIGALLVDQRRQRARSS